MPNPTSSQEFEHLYRDGMKNLELEKARLASAPRSEALAPLDESLRSTLSLILGKLAASNRLDPESVLRAAISALDDVEAQRFVLENLLEAAKRGEEPTAVLRRFGDLGLIPPLSKPSQDTPAAKQQAWLGLLNRRSLWRRVGLTVQQMAVNAVKAVPRFVEIEPSIALVGPLPVLSFQLKSSGMTVHELFEILREPQPEVG